MTKQAEIDQNLKKPYNPPKFVRFGDMRALTRTGTASGSETATGGAPGQIKKRKP